MAVIDAGSFPLQTAPVDTIPVTVAVPVFVSLVAVIVALPTATTVTKPLAFTETRAGLELDHVTTRPVSTLLLASRVTAESCWVAPSRRLALEGETVTDATGAGAVTVMAAVPVFVSLVAVIVALPVALAVTSPDAETVLMAGLLELQAITRPVNVLLLASRVTDESCTVAPIWRVDDAGDTETDATGAGGGVPEAVVVAETVFERLPYTAPRFIVPLNAISWKL
jgi:hypothetical protein